MAGAGAVFADYDNDGDEDLFLPRYPHNVLLRNDRGAFASTDLVSDSLATDTAIWLDYNNDGFLDLYATNNRLEVGPASGNGDGTFSDQTAT